MHGHALVDSVHVKRSVWIVRLLAVLGNAVEHGRGSSDCTFHVGVSGGQGAAVGVGDDSHFWSLLRFKYFGETRPGQTYSN
jgi:hypothetical protein